MYFSYILIWSSIPHRPFSFFFFFTMVSMAPKAIGAPSIMVSTGVIVEVPGNIEDKWPAVSGVKVMIMQLERLRERPRCLPRPLERARSVDRD